MVAVLTASPTRPKVRPHVGAASSRRYERRRPEKTPLYKIVSEHLEGWLENRAVAEHPVSAHIERELRSSLTCGILCFGFGRARCASNGAVELSPCDLLDRLADLVPPPRKHRHRYHGVFAPNHKLRSAVTALAIGNVGKPRDAATGGHAVGGHAAGGDTTGDCCDLRDKSRSHDTSRIAWAKLMARVGEEFPLECPGCGGDIRLIAFITDPGPIRKILTHLGEPLEPPPVSPARGPPTDWGELVQVHNECDVTQTSPDELPAIDIHSL